MEDRLKQLDLEFLHGVPVHLTDEMAAQIVQVVKDEGYILADDLENPTWGLKPLMTGQEWEEKALKQGWRKPFHSTVTKEQIEDFANDAVKSVTDFDGKYWVSVSGNVYSTVWGKIRLKTPQYYHDGYARVSLSGQKTALVHRLVAQEWLPNPDNKQDVNHKDGNKGNNHVTNLEWNTRAENMQHAFRTGLVIRQGSKQNNAKLTEANVADILTRLSKGETGTSLAKEYGVAHGLIYDIKNGRGWTHVTVEAAKKASGL